MISLIDCVGASEHALCEPNWQPLLHSLLPEDFHGRESIRSFARYDPVTESYLFAAGFLSNLSDTFPPCQHLKCTSQYTKIAMMVIMYNGCHLLGYSCLNGKAYLAHMKKFGLLALVMFLIGCNRSSVQEAQVEKQAEIVPVSTPSLVILGTVQDAGSPHIGCEKDCCADLFTNPDKNRMVVSLGIVDPQNEMTFLIDATPDITQQLRMLPAHTSFKTNDVPDGIFLTHAHMGHYAGLMYLGREALGAKGVKVYAMPRMKSFLETNGPWSQLVELENIKLTSIQADQAVSVSPAITITPFLVPHRDEYSETVGYLIAGPEKKALFIPDIDKWDKWERSIVDEIAKVDYAFLDATFFDGEEINNRDIKEIPHPFVVESMEVFRHLPDGEKSKIYFIHFNHTNPLLKTGSEQAQKVRAAGYGIAMTGQVFRL